MTTHSFSVLGSKYVIIFELFSSVIITVLLTFVIVINVSRHPFFYNFRFAQIPSFLVFVSFIRCGQIVVIHFIINNDILFHIYMLYTLYRMTIDKIKNIKTVHHNLCFNHN